MNKTAVIVCNGEFPRKEYPRYILRNADYIVCCDGALTKYLKNMDKIFGTERMPDIVIGDMDSISKAARKKYTGTFIHETEQDYNDQTKAVRYVIGHLGDVSSIYILGAGGGREDHTIGNLSLLMEYTRMFDLKARGITIETVSDYSSAFAITDTSEIHCGQGRSISIFSPDKSLNIISEGLQWKTDEVVFDNWWKATLNKSSGDIVKLKFSHPSMALIILN